MSLPVFTEAAPYTGPAFIQPVVVLADSRNPATYFDAVQAATLASVLTYATESVTYDQLDESWAPWQAGGQQRLVLRANPRDFSRLAQTYRNEDSSLIRFGLAEAIALQPQTGKLPRRLRRLEECRAVFPYRPSDEPTPARPSGSPIVVLDQSLGMRVGEASGHAARSLTQWFDSLSQREKESWYDPGCCFTVIALPSDHFAQLCLYSSVEGSLSRTENEKPASFILPPRQIRLRDRSN